MLDIKFIRDNVSLIKENCKNRNVKCDVDELIKLDEEKNSLLQNVEDLRAKKNLLNEKIKQADNKQEIIESGKKIKEELDFLEPKLKEIEEKFKELLLQIPNLTHSDAPFGKSDEENKEIEIYGGAPKFDFEPKGHEELMKDLDLIDFERGAKVAGSKFYFLKNEGALLEFALIQYAVSKLVEKGFMPMITPDLAREEILLGTGYNPRGDETQIYAVENSDLHLIGTSEITIGGYHQNEIIDEEKLPLKYAAHSHCFRTEAGAYGRHSSGLYRVHQFSKVEMFVLCAPEDSEKMHQELKDIEVEIFTGLGLPIRVVDICSGDLGGPAYRKYDLESWMTSKNDWGEITSTSDTTTYQSRRLNIRVKRKDGKKEFLHMLNGTAVAISRALIVIIENNQQADGSVVIPEVLRKWMPGGQERIERK